MRLKVGTPISLNIMPVDDALLFIDANKYLDLYRTDNGKKLLAPLGEQVDYVFVTQQVVNEVQRNKISVAANFLSQKFRELKQQAAGLPDHLSAANSDQTKDILKQINQKIKKVKSETDVLVLDLLRQISHSKDEVSTALAPIFDKAVAHSPDELQRARERRELGNPPGKINDPLGDQLAWEQILTHFKGKKRLWIISKDSDYTTTYNKRHFLNCFLYNELCKVASEPEVYIFQETVEGIEHFVNTTGVKAENHLTPEEVDEIKKEEQLLRYSEVLNQIATNVGQLNEAVCQSMLEVEPSIGVFRQAIMNSLERPSEAVRQAMNQVVAEIGPPNEVIHQVINGMELRNEAMSRTIDRAIAELSQSAISTHQSLEKDQLS